MYDMLEKPVPKSSSARHVRTDLFENGHGLRRVTDEDALGDLEFETMRIQVAIVQSAPNGTRQALVLKLSRRDVDGDREFAPQQFLQLLAFATGGPDDPLADRHDQAALFDERNEFRRHHQAEFFAPPAQERFDSRYRPRR